MLDRRDFVQQLLADRGNLLVVPGLGSATYDVAAAGDLEVATLSRGNGRRTFRRIDEEELAQLLA